ncbi:MAG: HAMP domain-containing protein [Treponema sp.]|jgi:adenylate cyclase|nr:HAMP domain-containing protein [Treponema sp.]
MSDKQTRRKAEKVKFSIGARLTIVIFFIVIISLCSVTALVSWLGYSDMRISAEESNFEINRRSAIEAESIFVNMRSNSRVLMQTINAAGQESVLAQRAIDFFFNENPQAVALFFIIPGKEEQVLINEKFFSSRGIDEALVLSFLRNQESALARAVSGETLLLNATPYLSFSCLAMFFSWQSGREGGVLFSSESLNNSFGFGKSRSFMINRYGDILVHSDSSIARSGMNIRNVYFIRSILYSNEQSRQQLIDSDAGFMQAPENTIKTGFFYSLYEKAKPLYTNAKQKIMPLLKKASFYFPALKIKDDTGEGEKSRYLVAYTKLNIAGATVVTNIEYNKIFEGINAIIRRNIFLAIAVLSFSIVFIWFFSKTISNPIRSLDYAARQVEDGEFEPELKPKRNDEIGVLTSSFRRMCSALQFFSKFTDRDIAVKTMRGEIKQGGFPKHATVFFSEIHGFTEKYEKFTRFYHDDAYNKIVQWLNNYLARMSECVEKTNGVVDKFTDSTLMAHWGTVYTAGNSRKDAFNCVKTALMMRKVIYFMNKERRTDNPLNPLIKIGCGIDTGIVAAGHIGGSKRMEYTVIGDTVNLASRIKALSESLGADILISEDTWRLIGDKFITEEMPPVKIKNKTVRIFAVINFKGEHKGPQTITEIRKLLGIKVSGLDKVDVNVVWKR